VDRARFCEKRCRREDGEAPLKRIPEGPDVEAHQPPLEVGDQAGSTVGREADAGRPISVDQPHAQEPGLKGPAVGDKLAAHAGKNLGGQMTVGLQRGEVAAELDRVSARGEGIKRNNHRSRVDPKPEDEHPLRHLGLFRGHGEAHLGKNTQHVV
jgi:hypothetical protein